MNTYILTDRYTDRHMQTHTHMYLRIAHTTATPTHDTHGANDTDTHTAIPPHTTPHHDKLFHPLPAGGFRHPPVNVKYKYIYVAPDIQCPCRPRPCTSVHVVPAFLARHAAHACHAVRAIRTETSGRAFRVMGAGLRPAEGTSPSPACMRKGVWMRLTRPHDAHGQRPVRCEPMWEVPFRGRGTVGERGEDPVASAHCVCLSSRCCPEAKGRSCC